MFCAISISCAASRATWAFARDNALPFSRVFARVATPPFTEEPIPVNAFLLSTAVQIMLGLIYLGSSAAFNAFASVGVICLGSSYAMPVVVSLARGRRDIARAPYSLGRWGLVVNSIMVAWILFAIVLFCMPTVVPTTPQTMSELLCSKRIVNTHTDVRRMGIDYASVVFVGFAAFSAVWYIISESRCPFPHAFPLTQSADGRHHYKGPPRGEDEDETTRAKAIFEKQASVDE